MPRKLSEVEQSATDRLNTYGVEHRLSFDVLQHLYPLALKADGKYITGGVDPNLPRIESLSAEEQAAYRAALKALGLEA